MGRVWRVLPQVVPQADMEATSERTGRSLSLSPAGGIDGRVRLARGGDLLLPPPEHRRKVYFKQAHYGPVYGRGAEAGGKGSQVVVRSGRPGFGGDVDGGLEVGTDGGVGGDRQDIEGDKRRPISIKLVGE